MNVIYSRQQQINEIFTNRYNILTKRELDTLRKDCKLNNINSQCINCNKDVKILCKMNDGESILNGVI